jgi:hypothetical protein
MANGKGFGDGKASAIADGMGSGVGEARAEARRQEKRKAGACRSPFAFMIGFLLSCFPPGGSVFSGVRRAFFRAICGSMKGKILLGRTDAV